MSAIAEEMIGAVEENFKREGRKPEWKKLADATIEARKKAKKWSKGKWKGKILQVSGARGLAGSITKRSTKYAAIVGSNLPYARIHQLGGKAGRGRKVTIPARPYLKLIDSDLKIIKDMIADHLVR